MSLKVSLIVAAVSTAVSGIALADEFPSMELSGVTALSTGSTYWTADRKKAAKERALFKDGEVSAQVAGSSTLDFSRSRVTPRSAVTASPYKAAGKVYGTEAGVRGFQCCASITELRVGVTPARCVFVAVAESLCMNWVSSAAFDGGLSNPVGSLTRPRAPFGSWIARFVLVSATWSNN